LKIISSRDNPLYKRLLRLAASSHERRKTGKALLDGMHLIEAYCASYGVPDTLIVSNVLRERPEISAFLAGHPQIEPVLFTAGLFQDCAQAPHPTGIIAICDVPQAHLPAEPPDCCVLLEGIQDPGNLGSILRSAAAAGIGHAFLTRDCAFAWSPKALRAGMGAHFTLAIYERAELEATAHWFDGEVIATLPNAQRSLYETDVSGRIAWLLGAEGGGLSGAAVSVATQEVAIPMTRRGESLNVAAAAAICFFERVRQRRGLD
jgi:TrmH family RNA methyltransferase